MELTPSDPQVPARADRMSLTQPGSHQIANRSAASHKKRHLWHRGVEIVTTVVAAGVFGGTRSVGAVDVVAPHWPSLVAGVALLLAGVSFVYDRHIRKHQEGWHRSRAYAEAAKGQAWKYRAAVGPYQSESDDADATRALQKAVDEVRDALGVRDFLVGYGQNAGAEVSPEMASTRGKSLEERTAIYREQRIGDQVRWYGREADKASSRSHVLSIVLLFFLLVGIGVAGAQFAGLGSQYPFAETATAIVLGLLGWLELRRYETIKVLYAQTQWELKTLQNQLVESEAEFAELVHDTEMVISKEHTVWVRKGGVV